MESKKLKEKGIDIIRKAETAFNSIERNNAENTWKDLAKYVMPSQNNGFYQRTRDKGEKQGQDVYDSTAILSCRDLSSAMHSTITNPTSKWHQFRFREDELNDLEDAFYWIQAANEAVFYALSESNFNDQVGRFYESASGLGTSVILHEEKGSGVFKGMNFKTWGVGEVAFMENQYGIVDTFYRKFNWSAKQAIEKFGDKVDDSIKQAYDRNPLEEFEFVHAIYPRPPEFIKKNVYGESRPESRPFASCYVQCKNGKIVKEDGYYECPAYASRWLTLPGELYGFGPGHIARADTLTLNTLMKDTLIGMAKAVKPMYAITESNLLTGDLRPGKLVVMRDVNNFKEMTSTARFDIGFIEIDKLRESIKSAFYIDKLMLPPRTQTGEMTAYEIQQRLEQMQVILGPVLSRLNSEFLSPMIMRTLNMLIRARIVPPIPDTVVRKARSMGMDSIDYDITYLNQLARSQQLADLRNIQSFAQEVAGLAQTINPSAVDKIDIDATIDEIAKIRNVPESVVNSDEEVQQVRQKREQQQQMATMLQAGESLTNSAKNAAQAQPGIVK